MSTRYWYRGEVFEGDLLLTAGHRAVMYADAAFESMRMINGRVAHYTYHLERLERGLNALMIAYQGVAQQLDSALRALYTPGHLRVRIQVARAGGGLYRPQTSEPDVWVSATPLEVPAQSLLGEPLRLGVWPEPLPHHPLMQHKLTANSIWYVRAAHKAALMRTDDVLLLDAQGKLVEAGRGNVFVLYNGQWLTPPSSQPAVRGVFRRALLETAAFLGCPVKQKHLRKTQLAQVEAAFVTNAVHGIMPVSQLLQRRLDTGPVYAFYQTLVDHLADSLTEGRFHE